MDRVTDGRTFLNYFSHLTLTSNIFRTFSRAYFFLSYPFDCHYISYANIYFLSTSTTFSLCMMVLFDNDIDNDNHNINDRNNYNNFDQRKGITRR